MKITLAVIAILALCVTTGHSQTSLSDARTLSVTGRAKSYHIPDKAVISIGVETDGKDLLEVKLENDKRIDALHTALKEAGIDGNDVQTTNLNVQTIYDHKKGKRYFSKFVMRNVVTITVRDLNKLGPAINGSIGKGGNVLNGLQFLVTGADAIRDSLKVDAIKNAKAQAIQLAAALGMEVKKPLRIEAQSSGYPPPYVQRNMMANSVEMGDSSSETAVSGGQILLKSTVSVVFEIE